MKKTLHKLTIEALQHKRDVALDSYDAKDEETHCWLDTAQACENAIKYGFSDNLPKEAKEELENYLGGVPQGSSDL